MSMIHYDIFNGDADGIVSLHQYRMHFPVTRVELVTGVKRDVELLRHMRLVKHSRLTVFDISHKTNEAHVQGILSNNNRIVWFDHHDAGMVYPNNMFRLTFDTSPTVCTNMLVDSYVDGLYRPWTIVGAFGDNLHEQAAELNPGFDDMKMCHLKEIGETLNYNGYGNKESDLTVHPKDVYLDLSKYDSPFDYRRKSDVYDKIHHQKCMDHHELNESEVLHECHVGKVVLLPTSDASVRYSGIYSNQLVTENPKQAFLILTTVDDDNYRVSIRAPKVKPHGASSLANNFETGGGREKAAGINLLPKNKLKLLIDLFVEQFSN